MCKKLGITFVGLALVALHAVSAPPPPKNPFALWRALPRVTNPALVSGVGRRAFYAQQMRPASAIRYVPAQYKVTGPEAVSSVFSFTRYPFSPAAESGAVCPTVPAEFVKNNSFVLPSLAWQRVRAGESVANVSRGRFPDRTQIDAVIFDMDGTLLNSLWAWDHAAARYLKTRGVDMSEEMEEHIQHISLAEGAQYLKRELNLDESPEEILAGTLGIVRQHYLNDVTPKEGVLQLLRTLHAQGIKISVATASDKELAHRVFEKWGLDTYIDFVITCDEVGIGKLSPAVYETALERLGTARERTLVVEDALYALKTAKKAGFLTAGIADSYHAQPHEDEVRQTGDFFFTSFKDSLK